MIHGRLLLLGLLILPGCSEVRLPPAPAGPRMEIEADPKMLDAYGLSIGNLVRRLRDEGVEILAQRETTLEVRTKYRPDALLDLVLDTRQGSPIRLRDVARIHVRP